MMLNSGLMKLPAVIKKKRLHGSQDDPLATW